MHFVTETAQVELISERVSATASTDTKPTWCGGARHTAEWSVTAVPPATLASTGTRPKRQLNCGRVFMLVGMKLAPSTRALLSSTSRLDVSAFCGIRWVTLSDMKGSG